jgi:hypothetical protein
MSVKFDITIICTFRINIYTMARVRGGVPISGTIGNVTFYQMYGRTYVRSKSSLTRKRVLKSKEFEKTRKHAGHFGIAAKIGSVIYKALPLDLRSERWFYRAIAGEAASLLYKGMQEEEVKELLWKKYIKDTGAVAEGKKEIEQGEYNGYLFTKESNRKLREVFYQRWEKQGLLDYWFKRAWSKRSDFFPPNFREGLNFAVLDRARSSGY